VVLFAILAVLTLSAQPLALAAIHAYQHSVSPVAARIGLRCRFTPTCSRYAETVIARDGVMRGGWKAVRRVARCGPWTAMGTNDAP
jgi:putative membrane protein insertion efficiency factor